MKKTNYIFEGQDLVIERSEQRLLASIIVREVHPIKKRRNCIHEYFVRQKAPVNLVDLNTYCIIQYLNIASVEYVHMLPPSRTQWGEEAKFSTVGLEPYDGLQITGELKYCEITDDKSKISKRLL